MKKKPKTKIITLSSFTSIRPIITKNPADDWVVYSFADLFKYQKSCFSFCPSIFQSPASYLSSVTNTFFKLPNTLKIAHTFWQREYTSIHEYKLGMLITQTKSQSEKFTDEMLSTLFPFLESNRTSTIPEDLKMSLWKEKHRYLATKNLKNIEEFTHRKVAEALVQKAWCSQVFFSEDDWLKIDYIMQTKEPFIINADISPLHAHYLISQISERYLDIEWDKHADVPPSQSPHTVSLLGIMMMKTSEIQNMLDDQFKNPTVSKTPLPRQLSPTISFASSYDYHSYSSEYNNKKYNVIEPTIMQTLVKQYGAENLEFISHFNFNRAEAEKLGVATKTLDEFFPADLRGESKKAR